MTSAPTTPAPRPADRAAIEAAFAKLPPLPGVETEERLRRAIDQLCLMARSGPPTPPARYRSASAATCRTELAALADAYDALADRLDALHGSAVGALADAGVLDLVDRARAARTLASAARQAMALVRDDAPIGRKPVDHLAHAVAGFVAATYEAVTGSPPTLSHRDGGRVAYGPVFELTVAVFAALGLTARPEAFVRRAVREKALERDRAQRWAEAVHRSRKRTW